jgi:CSLREA domain-containing protein
VDNSGRIARRENALPSLRSILHAGLGLAVLAPTLALADIYVVTRTDDPAPDACAFGDCSLREAVLAANAADGADIIQLPAGTLTFAAGEVVIDDDLAIAGTGIATTTLHNSLPRLFHVTGAALDLSDLAFDGPPIADDLTDAILGETGASLALDGVRIAATGGGVTLQAGSGPTLAVHHSDIDFAIVSSTNGIVEVSDSRMNVLVLNQGDIDLHMQRSTIDAATQPLIPAGIVIMTTGDVLVEDTDIAGAQQGILVQGLGLSSLVFRRIRYHDSSAPLRVITNTAFTIEDSEFNDNPGAAGMPGALFLGNGAQGNVFASTFARNAGDGDTGGAVHLEAGAHALIVNSTFSGNTFTASAAAAAARGAAIGLVGFASNPPQLTLNHVTIVEPVFSPVGAANPSFCLPSDQRGYQRPLADGCDAGATEIGATDDRIFANGFE